MPKSGLPIQPRTSPIWCQELNLIFSNFCKAFDSANQHIFFSKLSLLNFPHQLQCLASYPSNSCKFFFKFSLSGVTQGSVLDPNYFSFLLIIFALFSSDHPCFKQITLNCLPLFQSSPIILSCNLIQALWVCWCSVNKLTLNVTQCVAR